MAFNASKCKVMHAGPHNPRFSYTIGGEVIGETEEEKDIGVQINKNMMLSSHCSKAAGRATAVLRQLT